MRALAYADAVSLPPDLPMVLEPQALTLLQLRCALADYGNTLTQLPFTQARDEAKLYGTLCTEYVQAAADRQHTPS